MSPSDRNNIKSQQRFVTLFCCSPAGIELADFPTRELLFGVTSIESYLDFSAQDLEFGFNETRRDRILRTYVRNVYHFHLNEIFSALKVSIPATFGNVLRSLPRHNHKNDFGLSACSLLSVL